MKNIRDSVHCFHCWHMFMGAIHMVVRPGHVLEECCKCDALRQVHIEHRTHKHLDDYVQTGWKTDGLMV